MTKQELGKRLRALRELRGLTQAEVAIELETRGLKRTAAGYGHFETGRREPEIEVLTAICQILGCPLSVLFASEDGQSGHPIDQIAALEVIDKALTRYKKEIGDDLCVLRVSTKHLSANGHSDLGDVAFSRSSTMANTPDSLAGELIEQFEVLSLEKQLRVLAFARSQGRQIPAGTPGSDLVKFAGTIDREDLKLMVSAIDQDCDRIPDDAWPPA